MMKRVIAMGAGLGLTIFLLVASLAPGLPPGTPPERVAILRQAFQKLYSNPEFVKEWERSFGLKLDFIPGDGADRIMKSVIESTQGWGFIKTEYIPRLKRATQ
jgi:tripartite-type tricarboxylate transporter receptor subunit TctC